MKIVQKKYPIDIFLCIGWSILLLPFVLIDINNIIRILLSLPFVLFIPGYLLIFFLFPKNKSSGESGNIERVAFSFGLSMALVPLVGIILYYSPFGLHLESILLSLFCFVLVFGILAFYRWNKTPPEERSMLFLTISLPKSETKFDRILFTILVITIIITIITFIFVLASPRKEETLTEFYLIGPSGKTTDYPKNLSMGENANVTIGLINHEHKTINYTIDIWLINQTLMYNESTNANETVYHEMWFMDKISTTLDHFNKNPEKIWEPQWEYNYNFSINRVGNYALTFLLFTAPTSDYNSTENYGEIAAQKIQSAYENIYIWVNIY